jgi:hypothetical protein
MSKVSDCKHWRDWYCILDGGYCATIHQCGDICPRYQPVEEKEGEDE